MFLDTFDDEFIPLLKDILRKQMRKRKRLITTDQKLADEQVVFSRILDHNLLADAHHILLYYSLPDELPTHATVVKWSQMLNVNIYLPRVKGDEIEVVPYSGAESMSDDNPFHIAEPIGDAVDHNILDLVIVPGVAFDRHGNRMGRGKGYYDRLLSYGQLRTIGVGHDCQLLESIPCEHHDRPLDYIVTPTSIIHSKQQR